MKNIQQTNMITKTDKIKAMERESNITLISTAVAIVSFFLLLYSQNLLTTNVLAAFKLLTGIEIVYIATAAVAAGFAIFTKRTWLWEYFIFCLVMFVGYYLMHHGVSGIPGLANNYNPDSLAMKLTKIINTKYMTYALWAANVVYCVLSIALHSVKYNKIKKLKVDKTAK